MFGASRTSDGLATWARAVRHGHGAGMSLARVFEMQARSGPPALRPAAARIVRRLEAGDSLEQALKAEGDTFPDLFVALAAVGERTGRIPDVFAQLEEYYRLQGQMRREFRAQITWPVVQFVLAVLVIAAVIFILGLMAPEEGQATAPIGFGLTGTSGAILFLLVVGGVVGGAFLAFKVFTRTVAKQAGFEARLLRLPVVGPYVRAAALSRFCLALRLTTDSSLSAVKSVRLSLQAAGNAAFSADADRVAKRIRKGDELVRALGSNPEFPAEFLAALTVGETTGQIPEVMARQAEAYREEAARRMKALTQLAAWGVYLLVGAFIVLAIFRLAGVYVQAIGG